MVAPMELANAHREQRRAAWHGHARLPENSRLTRGAMPTGRVASLGTTRPNARGCRCECGALIWCSSWCTPGCTSCQRRHFRRAAPAPPGPVQRGQPLTGSRCSAGCAAAASWDTEDCGAACMAIRIFIRVASAQSAKTSIHSCSDSCTSSSALAATWPRSDSGMPHPARGRIHVHDTPLICLAKHLYPVNICYLLPCPAKGFSPRAQLCPPHRDAVDTAHDTGQRRMPGCHRARRGKPVLRRGAADPPRPKP